MCTQGKTFDHFDKLKLFCSRAAECLAHPYSSLFFLDLWRDPFGFRYFVLYGFQYGCTVLCGLVPICGSAIVWRSSRSPQGFGASLSVAWSHPTLVGIKLFNRCSQQNYPCSWIYCREDRVILVPDYIGKYQVAAQVCSYMPWQTHDLIEKVNNKHTYLYVSCIFSIRRNKPH